MKPHSDSLYEYSLNNEDGLSAEEEKKAPNDRFHRYDWTIEHWGAMDGHAVMMHVLLRSKHLCTPKVHAGLIDSLFTTSFLRTPCRRTNSFYSMLKLKAAQQR